MLDEKILMTLVGIMFIIGGGNIAKCSLEAKNLIQTAIFGMIGVAVGLFLVITAICGPPSY
jgi:hypothetical protein